MLIFIGQALQEISQVQVNKPYNGKELFNGVPNYSKNKPKKNK